MLMAKLSLVFGTIVFFLILLLRGTISSSVLSSALTLLPQINKSSRLVSGTFRILTPLFFQRLRILILPPNKALKGCEGMASVEAIPSQPKRSQAALSFLLWHSLPFRPGLPLAFLQALSRLPIARSWVSSAAVLCRGGGQAARLR